MIKLAILFFATISGCWMIFDGCHVLLKGKYFGPPEPGPWSSVVRVFGLDPFALGGVFVTIGLMWLIAALGLGLALQWGWWAMLGVAVLTLWYAPVGTLISLMVLVLLAL